MVDPYRGSRAIPCPACGAEKGARCIIRGQESDNAHFGRLRLFTYGRQHDTELRERIAETVAQYLKAVADVRGGEIGAVVAFHVAPVVDLIRFGAQQEE